MKKALREGAKAVAIHYNSAATKSAADETLAAIKAAGAKGVAFQGDLTTAAGMEKLFAATIAAVGRPDIAINTVGKVLKKPFVEITEAEYGEMTAVNSKSAFLFIRVPLTFECPHCKHPLIKNGSWFRGARHFACGASQCRVPITYSEKLMLFAKHAHLVERSSLSEAGGRRRS